MADLKMAPIRNGTGIRNTKYLFIVNKTIPIQTNVKVNASSELWG